MFATVAVAIATLAGCATPEAAQSPAPEAAAMPSPLVEEHKLFARYVGTWDADVEMASQEPGGAAEKSKARAVCRVTCGGLFMVTDFEGTMMGSPFIGHEVMGFDPRQQKYTLSWVDSFTPTAATGTGTFDAATKTLHSNVTGEDMSGQVSSHHGVSVWSDDDHHTWTMLMKAPDGSEFPAVTIRYSRRK